MRNAEYLPCKRGAAAATWLALLCETQVVVLFYLPKASCHPPQPTTSLKSTFADFSLYEVAQRCSWYVREWL